jgi:hypothetical protein
MKTEPEYRIQTEDAALRFAFGGGHIFWLNVNSWGKPKKGM